MEEDVEERKGVVTRGGRPVTLLGPEIKVGQKAPGFKLMGIDWEEGELSQSRGKVRLISVVYSLDTPVCELQTQRFEDEAKKYRDDRNVEFYTISMDLPFAQARYFNAHGIKYLRFLSDFRDASFGKAYGVLTKEQHLLTRAVFVIDENDIVQYVDYVKEIGDQPDYNKAVKALKSLIPVKVK
jgi:thiol peroxidase